MCPRSVLEKRRRHLLGTKVRSLDSSALLW